MYIYNKTTKPKQVSAIDVSNFDVLKTIVKHSNKLNMVNSYITQSSNWLF